jgi:hypothetical protein
MDKRVTEGCKDVANTKYMLSFNQLGSKTEDHYFVSMPFGAAMSPFHKLFPEA